MLMHLLILVAVQLESWNAFMLPVAVFSLYLHNLLKCFFGPYALLNWEYEFSFIIIHSIWKVIKKLKNSSVSNMFM